MGGQPLSHRTRNVRCHHRLPGACSTPLGPAGGHRSFVREYHKALPLSSPQSHDPCQDRDVAQISRSEDVRACIHVPQSAEVLWPDAHGLARNAIHAVGQARVDNVYIAVDPKTREMSERVSQYAMNDPQTIVIAATLLTLFFFALLPLPLSIFKLLRLLCAVRDVDSRHLYTPFYIRVN